MNKLTKIKIERIMKEIYPSGSYKIGEMSRIREILERVLGENEK